MSFSTSLFVFGNTGGFFKIYAQFFGLGFHQLGNHALFDNGIASGTEACTQKDVLDVSPPTATAVEQIIGLAVPTYFSAYGDISVGRVLTADASIAVIENQLDTGGIVWFTCIRAVENNVGNVFTAKLFGRAFAHYPPHRINDIRLAAAVGTHHRASISRQRYRRSVHE